MKSADGSQAQPAATGQLATTLALTGDGLLMEVIVLAFAHFSISERRPILATVHDSAADGGMT